MIIITKEEGIRSFEMGTGLSFPRQYIVRRRILSFDHEFLMDE